jgi:ferric-chelate reductase
VGRERKGLNSRGAFAHLVGTSSGLLFAVGTSLTRMTAGHIDWVAPMLMDIATALAGSSSLDLHISIFVTCLCDPEAVPPIPNSVVTMERPSAQQLLNDMITPPVDGVVDGLRWAGLGGGLGVCASGPSDLTREVANAVAKLSLNKSADKIGGVGLHTEAFVL